MSARAKMNHRCAIQRAAAGTEDEWGGETPAAFGAHLSDVPCRAWFGTERETLDGRKTVTIEERKMIVPLGTDVTTKDRIVSVTDRKGAVLFPGPIRIESVGHRQDHLALTLEELS